MSQCSASPECVIDPALLAAPSRKRKRAAEAVPTQFVIESDGASPNVRMIMGSSRKPKEYQDCNEMLYNMGLCFQNAATVDFTGCYIVANSPPVSDKERVRTLINDIWLTTGYRFTVKDHPPIKDGHKTRLWCSQDEARRCKNKSRSKDKETVDADGYPLPRYNLSGDPMAKSRFPCKSKLWITSRDKPLNNQQDSTLISTTTERLVTVRIYHQYAHEKYNQGAFATKESSQLSFLPFKPALPPHLSFHLPPPGPEEVSEEEEEEDSDDLDLSMMREEESPTTSVPEIEEQSDKMTPEQFQRRMRTHIHNIREFCSGLEYQLQFNDFRLLEQLESEGERFLSLVKHCLDAEGRLVTPDTEYTMNTS